MTTPKTTDRLHLLGIRHHGPGSARSVAAALDAADPAVVLIEGPPDADAMIAFAASADMVPPVALLVHDEADPAQSSFYPFATYSPEWQAMRWALARGRPCRFIDLPTSNQLAIRAERLAALEAEVKAAAEAVDAMPEPEPAPAVAVEVPPETAAPAPDDTAAEVQSVRRDPLGYLAEIAGYEDGEAWWNALVEQGGLGGAEQDKSAPTIFVAIESAMAELRAHVDAQPCVSELELVSENRREAHMRLAIAATLRETDGVIAVVCGAWHVPALRRKVPQAEDRALLKGLPRTKVVATWVPWTDTRLASASGYGAGVASPGWYAHLWAEFQRPQSQQSGADLSARVFTARWQSRVAALLRQNGRATSTAAVIEATRLAETLAALRDLALPGLDEMREATLATLLYGEAAPWKLIETELVIGRAVGEIDDGVPQMPLAADLARLQKKLKMKPEALDRELSLDLRSDTGLAKSLLLHRLHLIKLPWGRLLGAGSSRGTFRENWMLRWDPEFSVRLAEALVHGTTVELAAGNAAVAAAHASKTLAGVSEAVRGCLLAGLDEAARATIAVLQAQAAMTSDIGSLAEAIPPLTTILRYGTAREMPADELRLLVTSLTQAVSAGLVYACRSLQPPEAASLRTRLAELNRAIPLIESEPVTGEWLRALRGVAGDPTGHPLLRGLAVRALYDAGTLDVEATGDHLSRALSRAVPPLEAGQWLEGFLGQSGEILLHDGPLRGAIDAWLTPLSEDDFVALLPMLRRAFSSMDRTQRRRLLDELRQNVATRGADAGAQGALAPAGDGQSPAFDAALPLLLTILGLDQEAALP